MHVVALIMAGGRGERMRLSGVDLAKPLVPVLGTTLLERNLRALHRHGFEQVVVSVAAGDEEVLALAARLPVEVLVETEPLGNIGSAGRLGAGQDSGPVLVVYADNLTTIDLADIVRQHERDGAALTLAAHDEPFRLPYGRLSLDGDRVTAYDEKPSVDVTVCSAVAVLGPAALALLAATDGPMGLVDLSNALLRNGERVGAYRHAEPWVDVNDAAGVARAEALVRAHADKFA